MEAISEVQSFLEESLSDEDVGDVSALVGFDGSRSADVSLQLGLWLRKRRGRVTAYYVSGDAESKAPEFASGIVEHQARCICQSMGNDRWFAFESYERSEKYQKTPLAKLLVEKLSSLRSSVLIVGTAGRGGVSSNNLTRAVRPLIYHPSVPLLLCNARTPIDVPDINSMLVSLPTDPAEAELMVKSSCCLIGPSFDVHLYHIREPGTDEELVQSLRRYYERKQTVVHLLIEDPAPFCTKREQIVRRMAHLTGVPLIVLGCRSRPVPADASLAEDLSLAERVLREVAAHLFVVKYTSPVNATPSEPSLETPVG